MSPYQRAAAVAVAPRPVTSTIASAVAGSVPDPGSRPAGRRPWPGHGDRAGQGLLGLAVAVVLAAMAWNWLDGFLDLYGSDPGARGEAMRTWALDVVTVLGLGTAGVVHSVLRRGRPGRWPLTLLGVAAAASVLLVPFVAG
ncbi:hypothetical protein SAMN03159343_3125 [Klenkia marina]|uniref:Uncharacterized protein n=1 Tax=Klenkia marina TaxID=1960309 RepID=A0A1G4YMZ4_9ACTN|nr:hypothetical protein [Klenkia marina]SCX54689.1 hypothetical protein SAMN03159343_3125 [Klenkia marina]